MSPPVAVIPQSPSRHHDGGPAQSGGATTPTRKDTGHMAAQLKRPKNDTTRAKPKNKTTLGAQVAAQVRKVRGLTVTQKATYIRVAKGSKTIAYINPARVDLPDG